MADKFEEGKKYKFSIELYAQDCSLASKGDLWANECKGEEVTVTSAYWGNCRGGYMVAPEWCEEVHNGQI